MAAGSNKFNDFAENQLTKFRTILHPAGCFRQWAVVNDNDDHRFA